MQITVNFENEEELNDFIEYINHKELFRKFMKDFNEFVKKEQTHAKNVNNALKVKIKEEEEKLKNMEKQLKTIEEEQENG